METDHLKLFITEELFLLPDDNTAAVTKETKPERKEAPNGDLPASEASSAEPEVSVKHPVVVISEALSNEEKELLDKILLAVNVKPSHVHHIIGEPKSGLSYDKLIVFGNFPIEGVDKEFYNITRTTQLSLRAKPLSEVNGSREEKTKLWNALKIWFGL